MVLFKNTMALLNNPTPFEICCVHGEKYVFGCSISNRSRRRADKTSPTLLMNVNVEELIGHLIFGTR